ncbi:MAG TPA: hypothetical protein VK864_06555 [Longimicrobiales bacterium]|nr:hypothetical protein [Longimicrobiales bacterium]
MRKLGLSLTAAAIGAAALTLAGSAEAGALAGADGIRAALDGVSVVEKVHCTPGRLHRRTWPYDGCYRRVYRTYPYPYAYAYPYPYGYPYYRYRPGAGVYWGPGWGIGFGF